MALVELLGRIARKLVDDSAALDRRTLVDRSGPTQHMFVLVGRQELVRALVIAAERKPAVPRPDGDIGDGIVRPRDIFAVRETAVEHVELTLGLHRIAVDRIFELLGRISEKVAEAAAEKGRAAHLPEQPRKGLGARGTG